MNELKRLLNLDEEEKRSEGVRFTPGEIHQQPRMWEETWATVKEHADGLKAFLDGCGVRQGADLTIYLLGAGTSEYVGNAVADTLRSSLGVHCTSLPTTTFIPSPFDWIHEGRRYLFIHFARSGDSPESVGSYQAARELTPEAYHLVITCNKEGALARLPVGDGRLYVLTLPEKTNDRSLVMTSSYSSMALAAIALGHLDDLDTFQEDVTTAVEAARRLLNEMTDPVREFALSCKSRVQFLGAGSTFGSMQECRLKVLEMTSGKIAANVDTFLGLRHGPQVFVNGECGVVASLSTDEYPRRFEIDLLTELRSKHQGAATLLICDRRTEEIDSLGATVVELSPEGPAVPNELRILTDVIVGQLIGLFKSMELSLKPDNPSESGIINRVVAGVKIYPIEKGKRA